MPIHILRTDGSVALTILAENLRGADLRGADLGHANLHDIDLRHADLRHARLTGADLRHADLRHANLTGADLRDADLRHANLTGADLRWCKQTVIRIQGSRDEINAIDSDVRIGCERHELSAWIENYIQIGRKNSYTEAEIAEYGIYLFAIKYVQALAARPSNEAGKSTQGQRHEEWCDMMNGGFGCNCG